MGREYAVDGMIDRVVEDSGSEDIVVVELKKDGGMFGSREGGG